MRTKNEQSEKVYTTIGAYQAGFLTLKGFNSKIIRREDKFVFAFSVSDALYQTISEYKSGAMVGAVRFAVVAKNVESQILSARNKTGLWDDD